MAKYSDAITKGIQHSADSSLKWELDKRSQPACQTAEEHMTRIQTMQRKEAWKCIELAGQKAMRDFIFTDDLSRWRGIKDMQKEKKKLERTISTQEEKLLERPNDENLRERLLEKRSWVEVLADTIGKEPSSLRDELQAGEAPSSLDTSMLKSVKAQKVFQQAESAMKKHNKEFTGKFVLKVGQPNNSDYKGHLTNLPKFDFDAFRTKLEEYRKAENTEEQQQRERQPNMKDSKEVLENSNKKNPALKWISPGTIIQHSKVVLNGASIDVSEADTEDSFLHHLESEVDEATFHQLFRQDWPKLGNGLPQVFVPYIQRKFGLHNEKEESHSYPSFHSGSIDEDDVDKMCTCKVIYFPAEPGMGKTTFVDSLANKFKAKESPHRLKLVHMVTLQDLMRNLEDKLISTEAVFGLKSDFEKRLFERNKKNVLLFLDGLDEIRQQDEVLSWVRSVQHGMEHIFITGRLETVPVVKKCLKDYYSLWRFLPLNKEQLKDFFTKWWNNNKESKEELDQERLADYVEKAVDRCEENSRLEDMIGIPLMAQMVAVVFQEHAESYCKGGPMKTITDQTDVDSLYESFFDGKWEIFKRRHLSGLDASNLKILKSHYKTLHQHLGFENIFAERIPLGCRSPHRECSFFSDEDNLDAVLRHGIIKQAVKEEDSVTYFFQHRTFAEYSAAMFIIKGVNEATHSKAAREAYKLIFLKEEESAQ